MGGSLGKVDVVITCAGANNHLQLGCGVKHFLVHLVAANNQTSAVSDGVDHVLTGTFLNEYQLVAGALNHLADALNCHGSKGLLGCN